MLIMFFSKRKRYRTAGIPDMRSTAQRLRLVDMSQSYVLQCVRKVGRTDAFYAADDRSLGSVVIIDFSS